MEYTRRAGPPPLVVSHSDSHRPSFSMCRSVLYNVPGFIVTNPKAAACSMSLYPSEVHSLSANRFTGPSQFLGQTSILLVPLGWGSPPCFLRFSSVTSPSLHPRPSSCLQFTIAFKMGCWTAPKDVCHSDSF